MAKRLLLQAQTLNLDWEEKGFKPQILKTSI